MSMYRQGLMVSFYRLWILDRPEYPLVVQVFFALLFIHTRRIFDVQIIGLYHYKYRIYGTIKLVGVKTSNSDFYQNNFLSTRVYQTHGCTLSQILVALDQLEPP